MSDFALSALRKLPFSIYETQKKLLFKNSEHVTVSGESVVVAGDSEVKKYMFRYPGSMPLGEFYLHANNEIETVVQELGAIALPTVVSIDAADIFNRPFTAIKAVTQTQPKIDLATNPALSSSNLRRDIHTGNITLIDVIPIHADGTRLIGDSPSKLPHNLETITQFQEFVGRYGR